MKKQTFYKTIRNQNGKGYHLEEAQGYKKAYTDETGATIFIYFDNMNGFWSATEQETGAKLLSGWHTKLKEAKTEIDKRIDQVFKMQDNEGVKQAKRIKFDLLCQL